MKYLLTIISTIFIPFSSFGQTPYNVHYTPEDIRIFDAYCQEFSAKKEWPMNELVVETGKYFLGTPYVNFTLEVCEPEELIVNLRELDCVTFVETTIALARCIKAGNHDFDYYCDNLRNLRYRNGELNDFTSRLHYFSDWISNNEEMGLVSNRTEPLGGVQYPIKVNIMSTKPNNYRQLKANPEMIPVLADIERNIINQRNLTYIPQNIADSICSIIPGGYLLGTTTNSPMDITHNGILVHVNGKPHLMHASSLEKKVVITEITFQEYLESKKTMNGFMAVEILEPQECREKPNGILPEDTYLLIISPQIAIRLNG